MNPKLRFKGFIDKYTTNKINELFEYYGGLSGLDSSNFKKGEEYYIPYKAIFNNLVIDKKELVLFDVGIKKQNIVIDRDILITATSETPMEIGYSSIYLNSQPVYLNSFSFGIRSKNKNINTEYINMLLKNDNYRKVIIGFGQGSTRYNMSKTGFYNLSIRYPSLLEQTKIAKFFTLLDKQIDLLVHKLQLLEVKKKYYLNNLFCSNDSLNPKLRFKGFVGALSLVSIENIVDWIRSGGTPKSDNINYYSGDIPFISIPDMKSKYLISSKKFINEFAIKNSSAYIIKKDSLLLSAYATIGEICINKIDVALPQSIFGIVFKDNLILEYMYYIFLKSKSKFIKMQQVGSQPNISLDIIKKININITYDINEQTKIAKFFTLLDKQIENNKNKKEKLLRIKSYYLKNIFI